MINLQVVVQLANLSNFICNHQNYCHPDCYERQRRSCSRMVTAMKKVYQSTENDSEDQEKAKQDSKDLFRERLKRRVWQVLYPASPPKKKEKKKQEINLRNQYISHQLDSDLCILKSSKYHVWNCSKFITTSDNCISGDLL